MRRFQRRHLLKASLAAAGSAGALAALGTCKTTEATRQANPSEDLDKLPMRVGLGQFSELTDERMSFIKQCGVDDIVLNTSEVARPRAVGVRGPAHVARPGRQRRTCG